MKKTISVFSLLLLLLSNFVFANGSIKVDKTGKGQPMIFLPSLGCSGELWDDAVKHFSKKYQCLVISIAGFADFPANGALDLNQVKTEIMTLVEDEKLKNPILVGHSFGGFLALAIASENPGMFSKLIIVDAYPFSLAFAVPNITAEQAKQQAMALKNFTLNQSEADYKKRQMVTMQASISDTLRYKKVLQWTLHSDRPTIAQALYEMISTDLRSDIGNIKVPTLVLGSWVSVRQFGLSRETTGENFKNQYQNLENCQIEIAETAKHFIMYEAPEWFFDQIDKFLD